MENVFDFGSATQQAGQYFNSVTGQWEKLPAGAAGYGNGETKQSESVWTDIAEGVQTLGSTVKESIVTPLTGVVDFGQSKVTEFMDMIKSNLLMVLGVLLVTLVVVAKSGILTQSADLTRAVYGG